MVTYHTLAASLALPQTQMLIGRNVGLFFRGIQIHRNSFVTLLLLKEGTLLDVFITVHYCILSFMLAAVLEL